MSLAPRALVVFLSLVATRAMDADDSARDTWACSDPGAAAAAASGSGNTWDCRAAAPADARLAQTDAHMVTRQPAPVPEGAAAGAAATGDVPGATAPAPSAPAPPRPPADGAPPGPADRPAPTGAGWADRSAAATPPRPGGGGDPIPADTTNLPAPRADPMPDRSAASAAPADLPPPPKLPLPRPMAPVIVPLVVDPGHQDFTGASPWVLPPGDRAPPGAQTRTVEAALGRLPSAQERDDETRLHAGLTWDKCGPTGRGRGRGRAAPGVPATGATDPKAPVDATADLADYDRGSEIVRLRGGVEMVQGDQRLEADSSSYDRRTGAVAAQGSVFLDYPGLRLQADTAHYNLTTKQGTLDDVHYRLSGSANLRGTAAAAQLLPAEVSRYRDVIYTTCPPGRSDWSIHARDLELDRLDGMGTARNAQLRFGGVPVFYSPYLRFPIDDRRRSGLLIPTIGSSSATGTEIIVPYYWNIAPNMDATFYPRYMSARGLMLGVQIRQLTSFQTAEINGEVLPRDAEDTQAGTRGALHVEQTGHVGAHWGSSIDYSSVSDDQYLADFGNHLDVTSLRNLVQRGDLSYFGGWYTALARVQDFQTVDPAIAPVDRPYSQLPHLEFEVPWTRAGAVEYAFDGRYDYFDQAAKVHGNRGVLLPSVRLPLIRGFGHLIPRVRLFATGYDLANTAAGTPPQQSYLIPSLDVDGGLVFDRDVKWFGQGALQTLEPRIYYVLTPYQDQTATPLFDTTLLDFSYASLFRPNRFTGYDRVSDENRITVGLTSRTLSDRNGREWLRASVGQVYYFKPRLVQLTGAAHDETTTSSVAGELATTPTAAFSARASFQWDPNLSSNQWEKRVLQLRYAPGDDRVVNFAYRYNIGKTEPERYENTDFSFRWPLTPQVGVVGRWLYSLLDANTVDAFAGIEFGRCCWRFRILGRHLKTSADSAGNTSIMFQLELAGLGALGNKIDKILEQGIYGYDGN